MEMVYTNKTQKYESNNVVILVIMEMVYTIFTVIIYKTECYRGFLSSKMTLANTHFLLFIYF